MMAITRPGKPAKGLNRRGAITVTPSSWRNQRQTGLGALPVAIAMELADALRGIALHQLEVQALRVGATS
jgi:hypothetical protein